MIFILLIPRVENHYFISSSIPLKLRQQLHLQNKKVLFCFIIVTTYISNIKTQKKLKEE
jgi:hypothetical protein